MKTVSHVRIRVRMLQLQQIVPQVQFASKFHKICVLLIIKYFIIHHATVFDQ